MYSRTERATADQLTHVAGCPRVQLERVCKPNGGRGLAAIRDIRTRPAAGSPTATGTRAVCGHDRAPTTSTSGCVTPVGRCRTRCHTSDHGPVAYGMRPSAYLTHPARRRSADTPRTPAAPGALPNVC